MVRIEIGPDVVVGDYLHKQAGRGTNGVLVEMKGGSEELAHDVAVHIAFARPLYLRREDVPEQEVVAEREVVEEISRKEGKPEAAMAKVVEGRMQGWFKERCLLEQPYAKDDKVSIAQFIGKRRDRTLRPGRGCLTTTGTPVAAGSENVGRRRGAATPTGTEDVGGGVGFVRLR